MFDHTYAFRKDGSVEHIPTSVAMSFHSTEHGKMRRIQRGIGKRDLQEVMHILLFIVNIILLDIVLILEVFVNSCAMSIGNEIWSEI